MTPEQKTRLLTEHDELAQRLDKLNPFLASDAFTALGAEDRALLVIQRDLMNAYRLVLCRRIELHDDVQSTLAV